MKNKQDDTEIDEKQGNMVFKVCHAQEKGIQ